MIMHSTMLYSNAIGYATSNFIAWSIAFTHPGKFYEAVSYSYVYSRLH